MSPITIPEWMRCQSNGFWITDSKVDGWLAIERTADVELPPLRILLVEDSKTNQMVALAVLSGASHTTVVANDGQEALTILEKQKFDVVLMDVLGRFVLSSTT